MYLSASSLLALAVISTSCTTDAFQAPLPLLAKPLATGAGAGAAITSLPSLLDAHNDIANAAATVYQHSHNFWIAEDGGGIFDTVRNVAAAITAILFLLAGVTFLYGSFIIPAAAKELEKECKELDPQLWDQYAAKLGEGETMANRPDLMQELGTKLQPMIEAKLRDMDQKGELNALQTTLNPYNKADSSGSEDTAPSMPSTSSQWDSNDGIIDVEVEKKTEADDKK